MLEIGSGGVTIEDLRIEITEGMKNCTAVSASAAAVTKNVEIFGNVSGFGAEDGHFDVPRTIELGEMKSGCENTFLLEVNVPAKTKVESKMRDITVYPNKLEPGRNEIRITANISGTGTLLFAELMFRSGFTRRIYVTGRLSNTAEAASDKPIYTAPHRESASAAIPEPKTDVISIIPRQDDSLAPLELKRGQRVSAAGYVGSGFSVYFTCEKPSGVDVDPYIFLLDKNGKALGDRSLVFFGNERSENGEAVYFPGDGHMEVDLSKADPQIEKIVLAYSVYAADSHNNFSVVKDPFISLRTGSGERLSFMMNGLSSEAAVVALELYLYKGEWKISAVGAGYNDGMAKMCNSFGIDVVE